MLQQGVDVSSAEHPPQPVDKWLSVRDYLLCVLGEVFQLTQE